MTSFRTRMSAIGTSFSATYFPTRVRQQISIILRVEMLSTVAVIFRHGFIVFKIALRTFPVEDMKSLLQLLLIDIFNPLFDTF